MNTMNLRSPSPISTPSGEKTEHLCFHPDCKDGVLYDEDDPDDQGELCPVCAGTPPPQGSTQETPSEEELLKLTADSIRRQCERKGADIYIEYAKLSKQWQKWFDIAHPKAPPSCLACGQVKPFDIQRMDMPGIGICCHCVAALRSQSSLKPQDGERLADDNRRYLVAFGHRHVSKQDGTDTCAECDLDLRDPIHFRYGESRKTRQEGTTP